MKEHKHYYILDSNSFGKCKHKGCKATKQYPVDNRGLKASQVRDIKNFPPIQGVDTYSLGEKIEH